MPRTTSIPLSLRSKIHLTPTNFDTHMVSKCTTTVTSTCTVCGCNHLTALHRSSETEIPSAKQLPEPAHTPVTNSLTMCTKLCSDLSVNKNCSKTLLVELTWKA